MEPPVSFRADDVRDQKAQVLRSLRPLPGPDLAAQTVHGQYLGYRDEEGVAPGSRTPTYVAMKLHVDNWRWQGVPFYLRSGKALAEKTSDIIIQFRRPPLQMLHLPAGQEYVPNHILVGIQPDEGLHLKFQAKVPGSSREGRAVDMVFHYRSSFAIEKLPDAYQHLLLDVLEGDASLFTRSDEIERAWRLIDPIVQAWETGDEPPLVPYEPGSRGPVEAEEFVARAGRMWCRGCTWHG
jgi:glucose-6-phosphate 1-dehydrogenase